MTTTKTNQAWSEQQRWEALIQRDPNADGFFVYAVLTTRIYCRPGCASRLPNRENVRFFETSAEAEAAGFRPCKRCNPNGAQPSDHQNIIQKACRMIESAETSPSLEQLSQAVGLSPYYFQRLFKSIMGITPKQYFNQVRGERIRAHLQENQTVTQAVYNAGYASNSHFYEHARALLGMKPSQFQKGGIGMQIYYAISPCYLGWVLIAATPAGICAIDFGDNPESLEKGLKERFSKAEWVETPPHFSHWVSTVLSFLESPDKKLDLPLDIHGTAFQRRVWLALQSIPAGATATYTQIAAQIGSPRAVRAVASACASNQIAVAIPCHRVIRSDGELAGYRWGLHRKKLLLEREKNR